MTASSDKSPKKRDDIRFLFNAVLISLTVMAIFFAFQPYMGETPNLDEVLKVERKIVYLEPNDVPQLLKARHGKPVMLVVYASWCPYCQKLMPILKDMMLNRQLDHVSPLFLSMDAQPRVFSKYLVAMGYDKLLPIPYIVDQSPVKRLSMSMEQTGSSYEGAIPYIGFFDENGKMLADNVGPMTGEFILKLSKHATSLKIKQP